MNAVGVPEPLENVSKAANIAAAHAEQVDREGQFPLAAVNALRSGRLLSAGIPAEFGGGDQDLGMLAQTATALARKCGSTALIFAMHQSQVLSLARNPDDEAARRALRRIAAGELLVASATTEEGSGGDVRSSSCFVERDGSRFRLTKKTPVISYGEYADMILVTARRDAASAPQEQVLVLCDREAVILERSSVWNTLGFRGTCSHGYLLQAEGNVEAVMTTPYAETSAQAMLPVSHILWAAAWLGLAEEAVGRARSFVQVLARKDPTTSPPGALRLAEATARLHQMRALLATGIDRFEDFKDCPQKLVRSATVIEFNSLKVSASVLVVQIVTDAMLICGIAGYRNDSEYSVARLLRDAHGAALMINNERILTNNGQLLLIGKTL